jgi:mRNA interferase MazF
LTGYIMVEQIKSIDYASRKSKLIGKAPRAVVDEVLGILDACIYDAG